MTSLVPTVGHIMKENKMKITIYTNKEQTKTIYQDVDLAEYIIITANELWGQNWQVIQLGDMVIRKEAAE